MMKRILLFGLLIASFGANAQQKLIGTSSTGYDQTGTIQFMDSNAYSYNSWEGSLFSNEPIFGFDGSVFDWSYELPAIKWDVQNNYNGSSQPLPLYETYNNTLVNGNATVSESANQRIEFMYNASGSITNEKYYYYNGTSFELSYEEALQFNGNNNLTIHESINHSNGTPELQSIDSLFYDANNKLIRSVSYYFDVTTSSLIIGSESLITYVGNEVSNIQLYQESSPGVFEWAYDIYYTYVSGVPTGISAYTVVGGVPGTTVDIELDYTFGANNKISQTSVTFAGDLLQQDEFLYDAQNFLTEISQSEFDFGTSTLYESFVQKFYYQSTVGIDEVEMAEATVFPNPATDAISISTASEIQSVAIYAANGALMMTQSSGDIAISNLPAGVYIAKVKTSTGVAQTRFVKQ